MHISLKRISITNVCIVLYCHVFTIKILVLSQHLYVVDENKYRWQDDTARFLLPSARKSVIKHQSITVTSTSQLNSSHRGSVIYAENSQKHVYEMNA
jgi:hypothetical protein